jgi:hypothetical protein
MKRLLLIIVISLITHVSFGQHLDSIKHIEIISEVQDSMALINKRDIDKINETFYELRVSRQLNDINDSIINVMTIQTQYLDSILRSQKVVIENDKLIRDQLITQHSYEVEFYKKELRTSNNKKIV